MNPWLHSLKRHAPLLALSMALSGVAAATATAATLDELPVLKSQGGVLEVLVIARGEKLTTLTPLKPDGWVYDICPRPADGSERAERCLARVLWNDPAMGVFRHADAGYESAREHAGRIGLHIPMG